MLPGYAVNFLSDDSGKTTFATIKSQILATPHFKRIMLELRSRCIVAEDNRVLYQHLVKLMTSYVQKWLEALRVVK